MHNYKFDSAKYKDSDLHLLQQSLSINYLATLDQLEPELISRLLNIYSYAGLMSAKGNQFQEFLILLRADSPERQINALKDPRNLFNLRDIKWSEYKYAQILEICHRAELTHENVDNLLKEIANQIGVTEVMRTTALQNIIPSGKVFKDCHNDFIAQEERVETQSSPPESAPMKKADEQLDETQGASMFTYSFTSAMFPNEDTLSIIRGELLNNNCSLEDCEPKLIFRLALKFHYNQLISEDKDTFQGLLILLRADEPRDRIYALRTPENRAMLQRIHWSAYKYAQILDICQDNGISHEEVHNALKHAVCFSEMLPIPISRALNGIIKPNEKEAYGLSMLEFACKQYEEDIDTYGFSYVFTDASDFSDQGTFVHVLNTISVNYWPDLFRLEDIERHLKFSFDDSEDAAALLDIFDEALCIEFLMWPGVMKSILAGLEDDDRDALIESNTIFSVCFKEWLNEPEMNAEDDDAKTIDEFDAPINAINGEDVDAEPIEDFDTLINTLLNAETLDKQSILQIDGVQALLKQFHWSAYKYASILAACATNYGACFYLHDTLLQFPGFENVTHSIRESALIGILKPMSEDRHFTNRRPGELLYFEGVLDYSAKAYSRKCGENNADNNVFNADDFSNLSDLMTALNLIQIDHWPKIFGLKDMNLIQLLQTDHKTVMKALACFEDSNHLDAFLARPNVLETILSGAGHEERWETIASNEYIKNAFSQCIGQGRGDKVLELLGDEPTAYSANIDPDLPITSRVHMAAKKGFEQLNETQGLSSAQCKQFHFFSPQTLHPFLAKLDKSLDARKDQGLSATRLK